MLESDYVFGLKELEQAHQVRKGCFLESLKDLEERVKSVLLMGNSHSNVGPLIK